MQNIKSRTTVNEPNRAFYRRQIEKVKPKQQNAKHKPPA